MFLPYSSDAPLRYWPVGTISLVAINCLVFGLQLAYPKAAEFWILDHGSLNPAQWISSTFMHGDILHLLGNMVFLLIFGHIVEGRCGHLMFVALFVGIGIVQNMLEQVMMFFPGGTGSLGASSAIYGIMVIAALWSAKSNINCVFIFWYRVFGPFPVPLPLFVGFYVFWDVLATYLSKFAMSTPLLHSMGAMVGLVVGGVILWQRWVDCEGLDVRSIFEDSTGKQRSVSRKELADRQELVNMQRIARREKLERIERSVDMHLKASQLPAAYHQLFSAQRLCPELPWLEAKAKKLVAACQSAQDWKTLGQVIEFYREHFAARHPQAMNSISINQAWIALKHQSSPRRALRILSGLNPGVLNSTQQKHYHRIAALAQASIEQGSIEMSED